MEEWNVGMLEEWKNGRMEKWNETPLAEIPLRRDKIGRMEELKIGIKPPGLKGVTIITNVPNVDNINVLQGRSQEVRR